MRIFHATLVLLTALCVSGGCVNAFDPTDSIATPDSKPAGDVAQLRVVASLPKPATSRVTASPEDVTSVMLGVVWPSGQTPVVPMFRQSVYDYELIVENLPVGVPCTVRAWAYGSDGTLIYSAMQTGVVLSAESPSELTLNLVELNVSPAGRAPQIVSVGRPEVPVEVNRIVSVQIVVADPDDSLLTYSLTSQRDGAFIPAAGEIALTGGQATLNVQYRAPSSPGLVSLQVFVEDGNSLSASFAFSLMIEPVQPAQQDGVLHAAVNFPPTVEQLIAQPAATPTAQLSLLAEVTDDSDADALQYQWSAGGAVFSTSNPAVIAADQGVLVATLSVTDADGAATVVTFEVNTSLTQLTVVPIANRSPVIAGAFLSDQDVVYGAPVTLLIYASDSDGDDLSAEWSTNFGSVAAQSATTEGAYRVFRATWNPALTAGVAQVTARIADPLQASAIYVFTINQILGRVGLTANAGPDQTAFINETITLNGSASYSEDGEITAYQWEKIAGPNAQIMTPTAAETSVNLTSAGVYTFRLTVWNVNNSAGDVVTVTVSDPLAFSFSIADMANTGVIYFLDTNARFIRRYDTLQRRFLPSWSVGADTPTAMAVAPEGDVVYVGFNTGRIDQFDTVTGTRTVFGSAPASVIWLMVVQDYVFCIDSSGSWETHSLFSRETGVRTFADDWRNSSLGSAFAPSIGAIFTFRDGTSPNDIIRTPFDNANGTLGTDVDSPYHGDYTFTHPMRLFPDESRIAVASGVFFNTSDLTYAGSIGMAYKDLLFHAGFIYLIRAAGSNTDLVVLNSSFQAQSSRMLTGAPLRLWRQGDSLFVFTNRGTNLIGLDIVPLNP